MITKKLAGSMAGLVATVPMTVAMVVLHHLLPRRERYPLPPYEITMAMAGKSGVDRQLKRPSERTAATWVSHFAYGTAAGGFYGAVAQPLLKQAHVPPVLGGLGFGLAVWAGSYLGWLPALRILPSATHEPSGRVKLMVTAHVIWGSVLGVVTDRLLGARRPARGTARPGTWVSRSVPWPSSVRVNAP